MAGRIPQQFIDELLARVDLVELINARVNLRKAGREYSACCPFHDEKTPSFSVSPHKQFYHCFGCGAHGNAIGFLMAYDNLNFVEAVEDLAARSGLPIPREMTESAGDSHQALYTVLQQAADYFKRQLRSHPRAPQAVAYLKGRGVSGEIAARFDIGYAPPGWDNLIQELGGGKTQEALLLEAGLAIRKEGGGCYDRFRERIMFPIRDGRGRVIGFGGRVMGGDAQGSANAAGGTTPRTEEVEQRRERLPTTPGAAGPKYLNSPETPVFHKGSELYGLYQARQAVRNLERLLVVEGYMDVVALAQFDVPYVVATLGTATTREHLERLFRSVSDIVFCFDGDRAGRAAAWRALENALPVIREGRQIRYMFLPEGEDPDTIIRKEGRAGFEARIAKAVTFSDFFFEGLAAQVDMGSVDGQAQLVELARPYLSKITAGVLRYMMMARLAEIVRMTPDRLEVLLEGGSPRQGQSARKPSRPAAYKALTPVRKAIILLLNRPDLAAQAGDPGRFATLEAPGVGLLIELLDLLQEKPHLNCAAILAQQRDSADWHHLGKLAQLPLEIPADGLEREFLDVLRHLEKMSNEQTLDALLAKSGRQTLTEQEKAELQQRLKLKQGSN
ncbi:MAG: hypothetical protein A2V90_07050 [Gammaproteobacteria bacterium RBG_16_57_12]|nr:MAG: hypothetical protein A2V90_07050 [Gammaproteobacteria bacterium RBG_16_57_12]